MTSAAQGGLAIAITGSSGLIGSACASAWSREGHRVLRIVRGATPGADGIRWDPERGRLDASRLEGIDAVVHLAGENIAAGRWNRARKDRIRRSRVDGTRLVAATLTGLSRPPSVLVSASAIGYYGDRGEERIDESSGPGSGFLAETCRDWERATRVASEAGIRVVHPRIGVVLAATGGALGRMLTPFRLALGGRIGSGRQYVSWITLDDAVAVLRFLIDRDALDGPVNTVAPNPVRNAELTRELGRVLGRPTPFPLPRRLVRLALGEMGQELLLAGARIVPAKLEQAGFRFRHGDLGAALRHVLGAREGDR